ncbi:MAG: Nif11-like leader peptide family natural product precursor [Opitutales bacterium]
MSAENVEKLLLAGGSDRKLRAKYNVIETMDKFVAAAVADGYDFTKEELIAVLKEEELEFESSGNPRTRAVWLR